MSKVCKISLLIFKPVVTDSCGALRPQEDKAGFSPCCSTWLPHQPQPKSKHLWHANDPGFACTNLRVPSCAVINLTPRRRQMLLSLIILGAKPGSFSVEQTRDQSSNSLCSDFAVENACPTMDANWPGAGSQPAGRLTENSLPLLYHRIGVHKHHLPMPTTLYIIIFKCKFHFRHNCSLTEPTGLSVPILARSDSRKMYFCNHSLGRERYVLGL